MFLARFFFCLFWSELQTKHWEKFKMLKWKRKLNEARLDSKLLLFKTYGPPRLRQVLFKKIQKHHSFHLTTNSFRKYIPHLLLVFYSRYFQYLSLFNLRNFLFVFFPLIFLESGSLSLFIKIETMNKCYCVRSHYWAESW